jgi:hypothetical protein
MLAAFEKPLSTVPLKLIANVEKGRWKKQKA